MGNVGTVSYVGYGAEVANLDSVARATRLPVVINHCDMGNIMLVFLAEYKWMNCYFETKAVHNAE